VIASDDDRQKVGRAEHLTAIAPWKRELATVWAEVGLEAFCHSIGIEAVRTFGNPLRDCQMLSNPCAHRAWRVLPHSAAPSGVLHAFPTDHAATAHVWEEWFLGEDGLRHHVLTPLDGHDDELVFTGTLGDLEHPPEILGRPWRYQVEGDLSPVLFQPSLKPA
jgi:hypothetical protein